MPVSLVYYVLHLASFPYPVAYHINMGVDTPIGMPQAGRPYQYVHERKAAVTLQ